MDILSLELKVEDALFRIKDIYERTDGNIYLAFSGGKDSTVVAKLCIMAQERFNLKKFPFMFSDTGIEFPEIRKFVRNYPYENIITVKPKMSFSEIIKKYGYPFNNKYTSYSLTTYQNNINRIPETKAALDLIVGNVHKFYEDPKGFKVNKGPHSGKRGRFVETNSPSMAKLANKYFHVLHPDLEYKISQECCRVLKKDPANAIFKNYGFTGFITGIRKEEGGLRKLIYTSCTAHKKVDKKDVLHKMPIYDWTDKDVAEFIEKYNVEICHIYESYGLERTGCYLCPFAKEIKSGHQLKILYDHNPNLYKASIKWLKHVYMDLGIDLPFDEVYTKEKRERDKINKKRREEMLQKYRPKTKKVSKKEVVQKKPKQTNLF